MTYPQSIEILASGCADSALVSIPHMLHGQMIPQLIHRGKRLMALATAMTTSSDDGVTQYMQTERAGFFTTNLANWAKTQEVTIIRVLAGQMRVVTHVAYEFARLSELSVAALAHQQLQVVTASPLSGHHPGVHVPPGDVHVGGNPERC